MKRVAEKKKTWKALASALGVTDRAVRYWRDQPGSPTVPDIETWEEYIAANGLRDSNNRNTKEKERWQIREIQSRVELNHIKRDEALKRLISSNDVAGLLQLIAMEHRGQIVSMCQELPRRIMGDSLMEAQVKAEEFAEEMIRKMRDQIDVYLAQLSDEDEEDEDNDARPETDPY